MANIILFTDIAPKTLTPTDLDIGLEFYARPAGAYVLASWLRTLGYTVLVVPNTLNITKNGIFDFISRNDNDLLWVGLSTTFFSSYGTDLIEYRRKWNSLTDHLFDKSDLYRLDTSDNKNKRTELVWGASELNSISDFLAEHYPNVPLILGGSFITRSPNGGLTNLRPNIFLVSGNAELYVQKISDDLLNSRGISVELVNNTEYDTTGFKTSKLIYTPNDFIDPDEWIPVEISRGCAFNCAYCSYDKKNTTENYKIDTLREELIRNYELHGTTKFMILDDLYNDDPDKVKILYDKVWSQLPFKAEWISYIRLDLLWAYPETAEIIKNSGCKLASFGIETLHDSAGKKVGKGLGKARILETLAFLKEVWKDDIVRFGLFIAGLPLEPKESIIETIDWLQQTDLLHGYEFYPHWIVPPTMLDKLLIQSAISKDNEKYGITWDKQGWTNSVGMNYTIACELAKDAMSKRPNGFSLGKGNYTGARAMGLSHPEALALRHEKEFNSMMASLLKKQSEKIDIRLNNIFNITGQ